MNTLLMTTLLMTDRSNYDENDKRRLPISKNKKLIRLFKDE